VISVFFIRFQQSLVGKKSNVSIVNIPITTSKLLYSIRFDVISLFESDIL